MATVFNLVALFLCCAAAHYAPVETLILSYAVLGPAHYLTEISWLHDKGYFVSRPAVMLGACIIAVAALMVVHAPVYTDAIILAVLFGVGAAVLSRSAWIASQSALLGGVIGAAGAVYGLPAVVFVSVMVLTLGHVFGFTVLFVLNGAMRPQAIGDRLVSVVLLLGALSFVCLPVAMEGIGSGPSLLSLIFGDTIRVFNLADLHSLSSVVGFTAFAYAYHYMNWFLKTGRTGWHNMSRARGGLIVGVWGLSEICWISNPFYGFYLTLPLSIGHVILELPLNFLTIRKFTSFFRVSLR